MPISLQIPTNESLTFNLRSLALVVLGLVAVVFYVIPATINQDPFWFLPFRDRPATIIVYHEGRQKVLGPTDPGFSDIVHEVNQALSSVTGLAHLGPSPETMAEYRQVDLCVELLYDHPIVLKGPVATGRPNSLFIPLTGRHIEVNPVFTGMDRVYGATTLSVKDLQGLRAVVGKIAP
jgi:hypothetical protein